MATYPPQAEDIRYWLRRYGELRVRQRLQELRDGPRKRPRVPPMAFRGATPWLSLEDTAALAERVLLTTLVVRVVGTLLLLAPGLVQLMEGP